MATAETIERVDPTEFQAQAGAVPDDFDLFLGGGRGGGKTRGLLFIVLRHCEQYARHARVLIVRRHFPDMRDLEAEARYLFGAAYGKRLSFNAQTHRFTFPNGAIVQLDQIEGPQDFTKFQGQSNSLIVVDEAGQFPDPQPLDLLRSTLRTQANIRPRMILAANPGGPGHGWLHQRHVSGVEPWKPYTESKTGATFVTAPSTLSDNPHLSGDYSNQIQAATTADPELQKAWLHGDWNIARGAFFGQVFDTQRNVIDGWTHLPGSNAMEGLTPAQQRLRMTNAAELGVRPNYGWEFYIAGDHGSSAPAWFGLMARSPGAEGPDERFYPKGSLVLFDEVAFYEREALNRGLGLTIPQMARDVVERCQSWGMRPEGVLDDACFSRHGSAQGTLADEYRRAGFRAQPAKKGDRLSGWQIMRRLLADAGQPDKPGLYISERCTYWLATVPFLDRDPKRPEDMDTTQADHAADGTRYGCLFEHPHLTTVKLKGF